MVLVSQWYYHDIFWADLKTWGSPQRNLPKLLAYQVSQIESCLRSSHPAIKRSTAVLCITREFVIWIPLHRFAQLYVLCFCCVCKFRLVGVGEVHVSAWLCSIHSLSAPSRHPFSCSVSRSLKCVTCVMLACFKRLFFCWQRPCPLKLKAAHWGPSTKCCDGPKCNILLASFNYLMLASLGVVNSSQLYIKLRQEGWPGHGNIMEHML